MKATQAKPAAQSTSQPVRLQVRQLALQLPADAPWQVTVIQDAQSIMLELRPQSPATCIGRITLPCKNWKLTPARSGAVPVLNSAMPDSWNLHSISEFQKRIAHHLPQECIEQVAELEQVQQPLAFMGWESGGALACEFLQHTLWKERDTFYANKLSQLTGHLIDQRNALLGNWDLQAVQQVLAAFAALYKPELLTVFEDSDRQLRRIAQFRKPACKTIGPLVDQVIAIADAWEVAPRYLVAYFAASQAALPYAARIAKAAKAANKNNSQAQDAKDAQDAQ